MTKSNSPAAVPLVRSQSFAKESAAPSKLPSADTASRTPPGLKPIGPVLASIIAGLEPK